MVCLLARRFSVAVATLGLMLWTGGCPAREDAGVSALVSSLVDATPTNCDTAPFADAGADIAVTDADGDGFGYVYLDATASRPAGQIVIYGWSDDDKALAAGEYILVRLPVGTHPITLRIEDACGQEASDTINVVVNPKPADSPSGLD